MLGWVTAGEVGAGCWVLDVGGCLGFIGSLQVNPVVLGRCVLSIESCLGWVTVGHKAADNRQVGHKAADNRQVLLVGHKAADNRQVFFCPTA